MAWTSVERWYLEKLSLRTECSSLLAGRGSPRRIKNARLAMTGTAGENCAQHWGDTRNDLLTRKASDDIVLLNQATFAETSQVEHRYIHAVGATIEQKLGHQQAGDWAVHKAMA